MKDQYFGDLNDCRKYGLLRVLGGSDGSSGVAASRQSAAVGGRTDSRRSAETPLQSKGSLSLGIAWMLTAPDGRRDGRRIAYLDQPERYRHFDPPLFDALRDLVHHHRRRRIAWAEEFGLLPEAEYFDDVFTDDPRRREVLFERLLHDFAGRELIFFDPDNGLEVKSRPWGRKDSSKYLYWREVEAAFQRGHSVLIFQHFPRVDRSRYTARLKRRLARHTGAAHVFAFQTSLVVFLLAAQREHVCRLTQRAELVRNRWRGEVQVV